MSSLLPQSKCRSHGRLMLLPDGPCILNDSVHHQIWRRSGAGPCQHWEDKEVYRAFATQSCTSPPRSHRRDVLARGASDNERQRFTSQLFAQPLKAQPVVWSPPPQSRSGGPICLDGRCQYRVQLSITREPQCLSLPELLDGILRRQSHRPESIEQ